MAWAQRENDRRRHAYDAEVEAWRRREEQLVRLGIEAAGFLGCTQPRTGLPVELDDDEVLYRVLPNAELVEAEARHIAGLPAPALAVGATPVGATAVQPSGPVLPKGLRVVDAGMAVVTDRRVAFGGRTGRREWTYRDLLGPGHHPEAPVTLLHAADGRRPAGLQVPTAAAVNFRFYLTLAFAAATGQRAAVAPQIDALLAAHRAARPLPPPPVAPQDAPTALLPPERMAAAAAVVVAVAFAALTNGTATPGTTDLPYRAAPGVSAGTGDQPEGIGDIFPSPSARQGAPGGRPVPSPAAVSVVLATDATPAASRPAPQATVGPRQKPPAAPVSRTPPAVQPAPTTAAPPAAPPAEPPATTPPSSAAPAPAPSSAPPSADPPVVRVCLDPLRLPLLDSLLCPPTDD
ncbi:hypothetical protein [Micromonospora sp. NPDC006431]|uniref:hypothetical protein n=1 Tax=Micromonospora sp. NPDC006431 TaxID=3364235 RepID=UPI0036B80289